MSNKPISMTQISRIRQLNEEGYSIRAISRITGLHRKTITQYLCALVGDAAPGRHPQQGRKDSTPTAEVCEADKRLSGLQGYFSYFDRELSRTGVTRRLLWEEYLEDYPDGYGYTQFCEHYARHRAALPREAVMHLDHVFGDCLQADFAGKSLSWVDRNTGEIVECPVLVCVLPASGYTYVEALASGRAENT